MFYSLYLTSPSTLFLLVPETSKALQSAGALHLDMKSFLGSLPHSRKQLSQLLLFQGPFLRSYPLLLFFLSFVTSDCFLFQTVLSRAITTQILSKDTLVSKVLLSLSSISLAPRTGLVFYFLFRPSQAGFVVF